MFFPFLNSRDLGRLNRIQRSWRSIRRLSESPYEGPRVAAAWDEVKNLHAWPRLDRLSRAERLILSGSVVPGDSTGKHFPIPFGSLPLVSAAAVLLGIGILLVGLWGASFGRQVGEAWAALLDSNQAPSSAPAAVQAPVDLPTATATPTRTATPLPTVRAAGTSRTPGPSPTATLTPTPTGQRAKAVIDGVIRSQAHQDSARVGRLPVGVTVEVIQVVRGGAPFPPENRWVEIKMDDLHGFVYWSLLDLPDSEP